MIEKLFILLENKLILNKFYISKRDNIIRIEHINNLQLIKVPIYNKYTGLDYIMISFPLDLIVIDKNVFNPYIILSSYNHNNENDIDFFYQINKILKSTFSLSFYSFDYFLENKNNSFIEIMNTYYTK